MKGIKTLLSVLTAAALCLGAGMAAKGYEAEENASARTAMNGLARPIPGDVNGDGSIDSLDATRILIDYAGYLTNGGAKPSAGDVNGDGIADSRDATEILIYYARILLEDTPGDGYTDTIYSVWSNPKVSQTGKLESVNKYDLDDDEKMETVLKYREKNKAAFYMIYDDDGKAVENDMLVSYPELYSTSHYIFADFTGTSDNVEYSFAVIKTKDGKYRAVYEYSFIGGDRDWAGLRDIMRVRDDFKGLGQCFMTADHNTPENKAVFSVYGKECSFVALRNELYSFEFLHYSTNAVTKWNKDFSSFKEG